MNILNKLNGNVSKGTGITLTSLAVIMLQACQPAIEHKVASPIVEVFEIPEKIASNVQDFPAVVNASELTKLSFRVNGQIINLNVDSGSRVKKGDVLAQLDPRDFELELNDKKAKMEFSKITLERAQKMVAQENMSRSQYDELEAKYRIDKALYEQAKVNLGYVQLKAPFDGIIASVPAENYENTSLGKTVLTMHKSDMLEIKVDLPDIILAAAGSSDVERGDIKLNVVLDAYPEHVYQGQYKEHTTEQNQESKTFTLTLSMPQDPKRLALQGMPGSVEIDLSRIKTRSLNTYNIPLEALKVPDSLKSNSDHRVLWRINNSQAERVLVVSNAMAAMDKMAVTGDLKPGDLIVTSGMSYLKDGMAVRIKE